MSKPAMLEQQFQAANEHMKKFPAAGLIEPGTPRWKLYGLSKQATEGDCKAQCPPKENIILRAKWDAWGSCRGLTKAQAMQKFVEEMASYDPSFRIPTSPTSPTAASAPAPAAVAPAAVAPAAATPTSPSASSITAVSSPKKVEVSQQESTAYSSAPSPTSTAAAAGGGASNSVRDRTSSNASMMSNMPGAPGSFNPNGAILKQGTLYKQRDVFKGWRPRTFVLQDTFLHYYLEPDDPVPRKSMDIHGCTVTPVKSAKVGDVEYFPFVISHPKSSKAYNLSSDSKAEADDWIAKIQDAANQIETMTSTHGKPIERLLQRRPAPDDQSATVSTPGDVAFHTGGGKYKPTNPDLQLTGIPAKYATKVDKAVEALIEAVEPNATGWEPLFEKSGVVAKKRAGAVICVRGDGTMNIPLPEVFNLLINVNRMKDINAQLHHAKLLRTFNTTSGVQYLRFKQVWPTATRDFVVIYHWRLLEDGRVLVLSFSEKFDELMPPEDGTVRAELILGGYVITALSPTETLLTYVVQSDLKGTLPTSVVNLVSSSQPLIVASVRKTLEADYAAAGNKWKVYPHKKPFTLEDLVSVAEVYKIESICDPPPRRDGSAPPEEIVAAEEAAVSTAAKGAGAKSLKPPPQVPENAGKAPHITSLSLLVLLTPPLLYYVVDSRWKAVSFCLSLLFVMRYILRLHLGEARPRPSSAGNGGMANGRVLVRFPVDLGKLLRYLDAKREDTGIEITMTHIAVKAAAMVLEEMPAMNGRILFDQFYPVADAGVEVSVSVELSETETTMMKVADADAKPVEYIADELQNASRDARANRKAGSLTRRQKIMNLFPPFMVAEIERMFAFVGVQLGISVPQLGIVGFPLGVCAVVTSPNKEGDADIDIAMIPNMHDSSTPITITIGGIRILPSLDVDRKIYGNPVLNVAVTIDSKAASLMEGRKFCSKLQQYMTNPSLLDKADRKAAVGREDSKIAPAASAAKGAAKPAAAAPGKAKK